MRKLVPLTLILVAALATLLPNSPSSSANPLTGVAAISAGGWHSCALTTSGGVKCWGYNSQGQLGNGTTTAAPLYGISTPVDVSGLSSGVAAVTAGARHTCALTTAGGLKCWGSNAQGQLGDGQACSSFHCATPIDVAGLSSGVAAVSAGGYHTCALTTAGGVKCWGDNSYGQLGNGAVMSSSAPVSVVGLTSGVASVASGADHTCAVLAAGDVKCWGRNLEGELGNGSMTNSSTPIDVAELTSVAAVTGGRYHTCALTTGGVVACWGWNGYGQLGDGSITSSSTPVNVTGLAGVASVASSFVHTCAMTTSSDVKCWGYNGEGQLGNGTTMNSSTPIDVPGFTSGVASVAGGGEHACALATAGGVTCWGRNGFGQLGDGTMTDRHTPIDVFGLAKAADADGDGCFNWSEQQVAPGSEEAGGRRDYMNPWDFYDIDGNAQIDLLIDIFGVAEAFGQQAGDPDYSVLKDRSPPPPPSEEPDPTKREPWDMDEPDGVIDLMVDILGAANQFGHSCA